MMFVIGLLLALGAQLRIAQAEVLDQLRDLLADGRYDKAEQLAREHRGRFDGQGTIEEALLEARLGEALFRNGGANRDETLELVEGAVATARASAGPGDPRTAECHHLLGVLHFMRREHAAAQAELDQALAIRSAALGPEDPAVAMTLVYLAELTFDRSRTKEEEQEKEDAREEEARRAEGLRRAFELFARARAIQAHSLTSPHADLAWPDEREGVVLMLLNRLPEARAKLESALAMRLATLRSDHPLTGKTLYNLGGLARMQRDWIAAFDCMERAYAIRSLYDRGNSVWCLREMGLLALELGDPARARREFERGLALELELQSDPRRRALLQMDLASMYDERVEPAGLEAALLLSDGAVAALDGMDLVDALLGRASLRRLRPDKAGMAEDLQRARALLGGQDATRTSSLLVAEACAELDQGELEAAEALLLEAVQTLEQIYGPEHGALEGPLYWLATLEFRRGRMEECVHLALRAEHLFQLEWLRTAHGLREGFLFSLQERFSRDLDLALLAAVRAGGSTLRSTWEALIGSRALGFEEQSARRAALLRSTDPVTHERARVLTEARRRMARLYVGAVLEGRDPGASREIEAARAERDQAEWELAVALGEHGPSRPAPTLADLQAALPPGAALLAFACLPSPESVSDDSATAEGGELAAFLLRSDDEQPRLVLRRPLAPLVGKIEQLSALARRGSEADHRRVGSEVRAALWDPIARALEGVALLFVVPAGPIHKLDFAALPVGESQYLVESGPSIHLLATERELLEGTSARKLGRGLVAIGGVDFGRPSGPSGKQPLFEELAASSSEVERVVSRFRAATKDEAVQVLDHAEASEGRVCAVVPSSRICHLATHGFSLDQVEEGPGERGIGGTSPARSARPAPLSARDALFFSGLALAGANAAVAPTEDGAAEDGLLTAEEVGSLDLSGVEWVVLSSCRSAGGVLRSESSLEGLLGLPRALRLAGAHTVIASFLPVDDALAGAWMQELYRARLEAGCDSPTSVRRASLAMLAALRKDGKSTHPRGWGGFVSAGDWR